MSNLKVALQIGAINDFIEKDIDGTFKYLKEIGYDYVELGQYPEDVEGFKAMLDKHGLKMISGHLDIDNLLADPDKLVNYCKTLGIKYFVNGWLDDDRLKGGSGADKAVEKLISAAKILKENGIQLFHHNHAQEFNSYEGKYCLDWLLEEVSTDLLHPQIDTGWVRYSGLDPCEALKRYNGMIEVVHLKDFYADNYSKDEEFIPFGQPRRDEDAPGFKFTPVGQGVQKFDRIIETIKELGNTEMVVVEQDYSDDITLLEAAKISRDHLRLLGI